MQPPLTRKGLVLLCALFASAAPASAQTEAADASAPCSIATASCTFTPNGDEGQRETSSATGVQDGLYHVVTGAFVVAASTDLSVSMYQIGRGVAREKGFGAQWQDSPVAFAVTKSAMTAVVAYGLQRMHKTRPRTALFLGVAATAFETWLAARGARIAPVHP